MSDSDNGRIRDERILEVQKTMRAIKGGAKRAADSHEVTVSPHSRLFSMQICSGVVDKSSAQLEGPLLAGACLWRQRSAVVDVAEGTFVEKPSRTVADSRRGCRAENIISHLLERDFAIKLHFQLEPCNFQRYFCGKRFCTCDGAVSKGLGHRVLDLALRIDANHF
jgi:hypothetical protein